MRWLHKFLKETIKENKGTDKDCDLSEFIEDAEKDIKELEEELRRDEVK